MALDHERAEEVIRVRLHVLIIKNGQGGGAIPRLPLPHTRLQVLAQVPVHLQGLDLVDEAEIKEEEEHEVEQEHRLKRNQRRRKLSFLPSQKRR